MADTDYEEVEISKEEAARLQTAAKDYEEVPITPAEAARVGVPVAAGPGKWDTVVHGFGAGALKQGSDELVGEIVQALAPKGIGTPSNPDDVYRKARDGERAVLDANREAHPILDFLSRAGGDVASDYIISRTGIPVSNSAYQTSIGALSGLLGSDADLTDDKRTPENMTSAAASAGLGAGLGYVAPKAGQALSGAVAPVLRQVRGGAEGVATRMGRRVLQGGSDLASATLRPTSDNAILEALRSGGIVPFGTTQGAFRRLERSAEERGAAYAATLDRLEELGVTGPDADRLARDLYDRAIESYSTSGANKEVGNEFARQGQNLLNLSPEDTGRLGLNQAEMIKRDLQSRARWGLLNEKPLNEARQTVASDMRQAIEDAVEAGWQAAGPGSEEEMLAQAFVPMKQQLGDTIEARELAQKGVTRLLGRRSIGLQDQLNGMMASGLDPSGGLLAAAGSSALRARVPSAVASGAYGVSRLAAAGATAAANSPNAVQAGGRVLGGVVARTAQGGIEEYLSRTAPGPERRASMSEGGLVEYLATNSPEALGPYAQQIQQAAADGNLPLVHYTLQQTDPKYRAMIEAARNGDTQ